MSHVSWRRVSSESYVSMNCGFDALPPQGCAWRLKTKRSSGFSVFMWKQLSVALIASYGTAQMISMDLSLLRANGARYFRSEVEDEAQLRLQRLHVEAALGGVDRVVRHGPDDLDGLVVVAGEWRAILQIGG